jgi:dTDP-glucose 4,6-dehydratase
VCANLVRLIQELTGSRAEVLFNPRSDPGVSRMCANLNLAKDKLGYQPRVFLPAGLRLTLERDPRLSRDSSSKRMG